MAIYRIKKAEVTEEPKLPYPPEEYWRDTDPAYQRDLDFDEIAELNKAAEEEEARGISQDDIVEEAPRRSSRPLLFITVLICAIFSLWLITSAVGDGINWRVITGSSQLHEDESLAALQEAVVTISSSGGNGTGFNIYPHGMIVTNRHVVEDGGIITVRFTDGQVFTTREWVDILDVDMALIDIDGSDLPYVDLDPAYPAEGQSVIIIGNPLGYDWTISEGTVLGMVSDGDVPLIYLDAPVYPGSSGSPVFNDEAQVIGVIFARLTDEDNKGLAIPVLYLTNYLEDIDEH